MMNIEKALNDALTGAQTGRGSYGPNYDGHKLASSIETIIAAIGAAAQPEGEATLFQQMAKATIQSQAQFFLQKARAEKAEAETDDVRIAAREEITVLVARAEKAEAALINAECEVARLGLEKKNAKPAPQAGDALGKPVAYLATDLDGSGDVGFTKDIAMSRAGYGCTEIIELFDSADIDASRREAYDKGRAEGVGQTEYRPVGYAIFSDELNVRIWFGDRDSAVRWVSATGQSEALLTPLYAAPPASAAQQEG